MECAGRRSRHPGWRCGGCASPSILGDDASYRSAESATAARYPTCAFSRMMCGRLWASTAKCPLPRRGLCTTRDATGSSPSVGHWETAQAYGDTWEFAGSTWAKVASQSPPARQAHAMVFDERRGRTVIFGGTGSYGPDQRPPRLGDVWEFDGRRWSAREFANGPGPRTSPGAAYDSKRGVTVVFGGVDGSGFLGDLWAWTGAEWRKLADASSAGPVPRAMGQLAYDQRRDRVVLFGGRKGWPDGDLNDTWEWDGATWRRIGN